MFSKCLKAQSWSYVKLKNRRLQPAPASNLDNPIKYHPFFPERHLFPKRLTSALVRQLTQQLKQHKDYGQHVKPFPTRQDLDALKLFQIPMKRRKGASNLTCL